MLVVSIVFIISLIVLSLSIICLFTSMTFIDYLAYIIAIMFTSSIIIVLTFILNFIKDLLDKE